MKQTNIMLKAVTTIVLIYMLAFSACPAQAALSARYESKAGGTQATAKAVQPKGQPQVQAQPKTRSKPGVEVVSSQALPKKYIKVIEKNQADFYNAFVNAEMGLRYMFSCYKMGKKEPSEEQFKAMKFEVDLLIKDLQSSAKRYSSNLRLAKMAMLQMDEKERTVLAKALGHFFASPAYAAGFDATAIDKLATAMDTIAGSTPNIDTRTFRDVMEAQLAKDAAEAAYQNGLAKAYTVGIVGAAGTKVVCAQAGMYVGIMTGGPVGGTAAFVGGVCATAVATVELSAELSEALDGRKPTEPKDMKDLMNTLNTISVVANVVNATSSLPDLAKGGAETVNVVIGGATSAKDAIGLISDTPKDAKAPGAAGAKAVERGQNSTGGGGDGGGGSGGGGSGGCGC